MQKGYDILLSMVTLNQEHEEAFHVFLKMMDYDCPWQYVEPGNEEEKQKAYESWCGPVFGIDEECLRLQTRETKACWRAYINIQAREEVKKAATLEDELNWLINFYIDWHGGPPCCYYPYEHPLLVHVCAQQQSLDKDNKNCIADDHKTCWRNFLKASVAIRILNILKQQGEKE